MTTPPGTLVQKYTTLAGRLKQPFCSSMSVTNSSTPRPRRKPSIPLCVLRCLYRFHYAREIPGKPLFQRRYTMRSSLGYGRRQPDYDQSATATAAPRDRALSADQVARLERLSHLSRSRHGRPHVAKRLRSCEVLQLQLEDLCSPKHALHVLVRAAAAFLPLPSTLFSPRNYLHLERPLTNTSALFVLSKAANAVAP